MGVLDYKESWVLKNWCFWTVVLEKTLESPLDCKEIQPVHPKKISPGYSLEGLMLKLNTILWPPNAKNWLLGKDPDAGKDWRQKEKGTVGDEMVGWHRRFSGHEFEGSGRWWWTGRPGGLQPRVAESDTTEQLKNKENKCSLLHSCCYFLIILNLEASDLGRLLLCFLSHLLKK